MTSEYIYVPGLWRCAKCKFTLVQANLNVADGSVTARDEPDRCPNCNLPLWRVTERAARIEAEQMAEQAVTQRIDIEDVLRSLIGHWDEFGPDGLDELFDRARAALKGGA
jgi:hypothetical protein